MPTMLLRVRQTSANGWVQNFSSYGWLFRHNGAWLQMSPANTKIRSADGTTWEDTA